MDAFITCRGGTDRPNTEFAALIEQALAVLEQQGARAAASYLTARGAGFALTCRVLTEPDRRRAICTAETAV